MYSTGDSSAESRFAVYLVEGYAFGEMESNVRFRELVMLSDATETTVNDQYVCAWRRSSTGDSAYIVLGP